jgi:hypothetical protein
VTYPGLPGVLRHSVKLRTLPQDTSLTAVGLHWLLCKHAEYPAVSVGENISPDTGHIALKPAASRGGSQSVPLFTRAF